MNFQILAAAIGILLLSCFGYLPGVHAQTTGTVTIEYVPGRPVNTFVPSNSLGAGVDGNTKSLLDRMWKPENVKAMLSAGFKPLSYRLRTELADEAWHWNSVGTWSDEAKKEGYWESSAELKEPIRISFGYRLPRRGNTSDQANDDGYSRLDDGDANTFWKSSPYLDSKFTGEDDAQHPQWVVIDLGRETDVNAVKINWALPFAKRCEIDYALEIGDIYSNFHAPGIWTPFPSATITNRTADDRAIRVSDSPIRARYVRILMTGSSGTSLSNSQDARDRAGFAIREIGIGMLDAGGRFVDAVRHAAGRHKQSVAYVSSTDPWHRSTDLDTQVEQPGIDRVYASGLTNNLPALVAVGTIFDTPENAAALVRYTEARHYPIDGIELGEEVDGQIISPEDYGAVYLQWDRALRAVDPNLKIGGPSLATISPENPADTHPFSEKQWMQYFLKYLDDRKQLGAFNFFSFEWYPFDQVCAPKAPQLADAPRLLTNALKEMRADILPKNVPIWITEYGYSAYGSEAEVGIEGALFNADIVGRFLTVGGERAYLYGLEPNEIYEELPCKTWGNNTLFGMDEAGKITYRTGTYYGARMLTQSWAQPADASLQVFEANSDVLDKTGRQLITAYALLRPDNEWSLMLINKDPVKALKTDIKILNRSTNQTSLLKLPVELNQFSEKQYKWLAQGENSRPIRSLPPTETKITTGGPITLPPYSLTVVKEL
jgi:F5/8 type C domain